MRIPLTTAFSEFLMDHSTIYPYSNLKPTRQTFYCKWVLVTGTDRGMREYFPVLSNSYSNRVLLEMISSGVAKPFPPELTKIMDSMYWWGRMKNVQWYDEVIAMLEDALDNDSEYERKELLRALFSFQVKVEIGLHVQGDSFMADIMWIDWVLWFNLTYEDEMKHKSFHVLALRCFDYVHWRFGQLYVPQQVNSA
jgi:hypothetical protein